MMVNAMLFIRTGAPLRDLAQEYGSWESVYTRFRRWSKSGLWDEIFENSFKNSNNDMNIIDSTIVMIHQHSSGTKGGHFFQALDKSVGGLTTKIHILTDGNGLPLKIHLTEWKTHDSVPAKNFLKNLITDSLIGDKEYASFDIIDFIQNQGGKSVIPSRKQT